MIRAVKWPVSGSQQGPVVHVHTALVCLCVSVCLCVVCERGAVISPDGRPELQSGRHTPSQHHLLQIYVSFTASTCQLICVTRRVIGEQNERVEEGEEERGWGSWLFSSVTKGQTDRQLSATFYTMLIHFHSLFIC